MHYLIKFVPVRNSVALAGRFWPMGSPEVRFGLWPAEGSAEGSAEDSAGARGSKSNSANTHGLQVGVDSRQEASVSHQMYLSTELLGALVTSWLAFSGMSDETEPGGSRNVFWDLASEVTLRCFCKVVLVTQVSTSSLWIPGGGVTGDHLGDWIPYLSFNPSLFLPETEVSFVSFLQIDFSSPLGIS